ncbi:MAG TPA: DUF86 domain-containing protein [Longimicrobiaceae bacterium]|nr:DUF86 domain-containing protein [Longimicrobiaceae bacterium]
MCQSLRMVSRYVDGREQAELRTDSMLEDAVVRRLTIVGEAAARIDAEFRSAHPEIPWRKIVGLRNVVTHQYDRINLEEIWTVATQDVPGVLAQLEPLLDAEERRVSESDVENS